MKLRKKDLPNLIAFCIAAAVVGAGIMTGHAWAPREAAATASPPLAISSASDRQAGDDADRLATQRVPVEVQERAETGPPPAVDEPKAAPIRSEPKPRPAAAPPARRTSVSSAAVPPSALPPLLPPLGVPAATGSAPLPQPDVLRLAGIVKGEDAKLALLRRGDKRYLVREGDTVEGVYRVTKITDNTVVLRRKSRTQTLRLSQA